MTTAEITYEQVLENALKLTPFDRERLLDYLAAQQPIRPRKSLAEIAAEQGKGPIDFDDLLRRGEFFPADESVDDLIAFVYDSRADRPPQKR